MLLIDVGTKYFCTYSSRIPLQFLNSLTSQGLQTQHTAHSQKYIIFFVMILEERSFYPYYSSDPGPTFLGLIYPGPTFLGQFNISDLTNTQRAQVTIDMGLVEREIIILSQLHVINVQRLREFENLAVRYNSSGAHAT